MAWTPLSGGGGYDGDLTVETEYKPNSVTPVQGRGIPPSAGAYTYRQYFIQFRANWAPKALDSSITVAGLGTVYLVEETETQDYGGGLVSWERVWATIPGTFSVPCVATKALQFAFYQWTSASSFDVSIGSISRTLKGFENWTFYRNENSLAGNQIPPAPFIAIMTVNNNKFISDYSFYGGTPFPQVTASPPGVGSQYSHNNYTHVIGGSIEPYLGRMFLIKQTYA